MVPSNQAWCASGDSHNSTTQKPVSVVPYQCPKKPARRGLLVMCGYCQPA
jgi:hypothetical protein